MVYPQCSLCYKTIRKKKYRLVPGTQIWNLVVLENSQPGRHFSAESVVCQHCHDQYRRRTGTVDEAENNDSEVGQQQQIISSQLDTPSVPLVTSSVLNTLGGQQGPSCVLPVIPAARQVEFTQQLQEIYLSPTSLFTAPNPLSYTVPESSFYGASTFLQNQGNASLPQTNSPSWPSFSNPLAHLSNSQPLCQEKPVKILPASEAYCCLCKSIHGRHRISNLRFGLTAKL